MPFVPIPEYSEVEGLRSNRKFKSLMDQAIQLSGDMKRLKEEYDDIRESLDKVLKDAEVTGSITYNGYRATIIESEGKPKVNMKKLLAVLGPKGPSIIKKAMDPGKPTHYIQIAPLRDNAEVAE